MQPTGSIQKHHIVSVLFRMGNGSLRNGNGIFLPHLKYWNVQLLSYHLQLLDRGGTIDITGS